MTGRSSGEPTPEFGGPEGDDSAKGGKVSHIEYYLLQLQGAIDFRERILSRYPKRSDGSCHGRNATNYREQQVAPPLRIGGRT